jgi:hypothetical protein
MNKSVETSLNIKKVFIIDLLVKYYQTSERFLKLGDGAKDANLQKRIAKLKNLELI